MRKIEDTYEDGVAETPGPTGPTLPYPTEQVTKTNKAVYFILAGIVALALVALLVA